MKKLLIVLLALSLVFAMAACSPAEEDPAASANGENGGEAGAYSSSEALALLQSGKYYMDYTAYVMDIEADIKMAVDGDDSDVITSAMGMTARNLMLDGMIYSFDDTTMTYTASSAADLTEAVTSGEMTEQYQDLVFAATGNGAIPGLEEIDAAAYDYDEYTLDDISMRFYMNDSSLYAVYTAVEGIDTVMVINELSADIPEGMLVMPKGYTEAAAQ